MPSDMIKYLKHHNLQLITLFRILISFFVSVMVLDNVLVKLPFLCVDFKLFCFAKVEDFGPFFANTEPLTVSFCTPTEVETDE